MSIPDDFEPKPTLPTGGLERMIQIWEASRDANSGGYGSASVLVPLLIIGA